MAQFNTANSHEARESRTALTEKIKAVVDCFRDFDDILTFSKTREGWDLTEEIVKKKTEDAKQVLGELFTATKLAKAHIGMKQPPAALTI